MAWRMGISGHHIMRPRFSAKHFRVRNFAYYSAAHTGHELEVDKATPLVSYAHGASPHPLRYTTLGEVVDSQAAAFANRIAFISRHQSVRRTYAEFQYDVDRLALGFLTLGCEPGDRLGIWSPSTYEWIVTQFATAKAGLILVNINSSYKPKELLHVLNKVACRLLVLTGGFRNTNYLEYMAELIPGLADSDPLAVRCREIPALRSLVLIGEQSFAVEQSESAVTAKASEPTPPGYLLFNDVIDQHSGGKSVNEYASKKLKNISNHLNADMPVNIQFTSGTTGSPKAATLTHHNIMNNAYFVGLNMGYDREQPTLCCSVPLYHCFGCVLGVLGSFQHGGTLVLPNEYFDAARVLEAVEAERCDTIYGVPTMFSDVIHHETRASHDLSSLRRGIMSGAPCPAPLLEKCIDILNIKNMNVVYGTTETSPVVCMSHADADFATRLTQVGKPLDHVELKIADADGNAVPRNVPGEVLARGYTTMLGYWNEPDKTAEAITPTRWYKTGDLGVMRDDTYIKIVGRIKDMIIRGGENVYPTEIENVILKHELVCEAHVVGVGDERLGEEIGVWLKLQTLPGSRQEFEQVAHALRAFCRAEMAHFKVPRYFLMHDKAAEFPVTITGKVQKHLMRAQTDALLKSTDEQHEHLVYIK